MHCILYCTFDAVAKISDAILTIVTSRKTVTAHHFYRFAELKFDQEYTRANGTILLLQQEILVQTTYTLVQMIVVLQVPV